MNKALAIDVGGTKIYNAIIDKTGQILTEVERHSTPETFDEIRAIFIEIIRKYENDVDVIAFSTCGAVNNDNTGIVGSTGNIAHDYPKMDFRNLSKKRVFVENDANCAAWAEHETGASKGCAHSVMLTLGTGVGGGIIIDNKILKGQNGAAGEMHFKIANNHRKCTCGAEDCFECYASGNGLRQTAIKLLDDKNVTTYDVIEGVNNKDAKMLEVFNKWQDDIIDGIIGLSNIFDPECVVLSGSMAQFTNTEKIEKQVNAKIVTTPVKVRKATAGNYSGMIGASLLALNYGEQKQ